MKKKIAAVRSKVIKEIMKQVPVLTIERVMWDSTTGEVTAIDVHNESNGKAYFFSNPSAHFHGFNNPKNAKKPKFINSKKKKK